MTSYWKCCAHHQTSRGDCNFRNWWLFHKAKICLDLESGRRFVYTEASSPYSSSPWKDNKHCVTTRLVVTDNMNNVQDWLQEGWRGRGWVWTELWMLGLKIKARVRQNVEFEGQLRGKWWWWDCKCSRGVCRQHQAIYKEIKVKK
jgi:hypothetical protein